MPKDQMKFTVQDAELRYPNFSGRETMFKPKGDRTFGCFLDDETAAGMAADGWLIKQADPKEEGEDPRPYINVGIKYVYRPPVVVLITSVGRSYLDEETIGVLDSIDIKTVDFTAVAYNWEMPGGKSGIKALLKTMYVTQDEDELDRKYATRIPNED